jgi:hypothetical protein
MQAHIDSMLTGIDHLFVVDVGDKNDFNNKYLDSFPAGTNDIFRERREHDCGACRHFVKDFGNAVSIKNGEMNTIWDLDAGEYQPVADAMAAFVKSRPVTDVFVTDRAGFGIDYNTETVDGQTLRWNHFRVELPRRFVNRKTGTTLDTIRGRFRDTCHVFQRSLDELSEDSVLTVLDLATQNSLYKGEEWVPVLRKFLEYKKAYNKIPESRRVLFCWENSVKAGDAAGRIRNHSIGTLLEDISIGVDLNEAVAKYEEMVAPANYKRPKAIYTQRMIEDARKKIAEMGFLDSLERRYAALDDITINNILFANRDAVSRIGGGDVFDRMAQAFPANPKSFDRVEEVPILSFIRNVLPTARSIEVLPEGLHFGNMVSLIAPGVKDSRTMFKWGNNFSWAYAGNVTDAMKERVKSAGGKVDGVLRFSIQWNESGRNMNDFDAWCKLPDGDRIGFSRKMNHSSRGELDVDVLQPSKSPNCNFGRRLAELDDNGHGSKIAVENITWPDTTFMPEGVYEFSVNCYSNRGGLDGFRAEIEFNSQIFHFDYPKAMRVDEDVIVAEVKYSRKEGFSIVKSLESASQLASRELWGVKTNQFVPVSVIMRSPNYWDDQAGIGNLHYFFMLRGCVNPESPNGFFNEYLQQELMAHKRVFEALGGMMRVRETGDQLSGLGFSSTQRASLICKVDGRVSRTVKITF